MLRTFQMPLVYGCLSKWTLQNVCNVIRFRGRLNNKHVQGNDIQDALSPSTAIFFYVFLMKQYSIRINPYV